MKLEKENKILNRIDWIYLAVIGFLLVNLLALYIMPKKDPEPITINHIASVVPEAGTPEDVRVDEQIAEADNSFMTASEAQNYVASGGSYNYSDNSSKSTTSSTKKTNSSKPKATAKPKQAAYTPNFPININTCSAADLMWFDGIGEITANKIIAARPYNILEELKTKKVGVGEVKFARMLPYITCK